MRVRRIQPLGPIKQDRPVQKAVVITNNPKSNKILPWLKCPKCGSSLTREILSKEIVEKSGCKCRGSRVVIKYKYLCTSCGYTETKMS